MSVQLIVYPQSYNGVFNAFSGSTTELIVGGINFAGIDNTSIYETNSATPYLDVINGAFPLVVNTWYRYRSSIVGTPAYPISNGPNVVLDSLGNGSTEPTGIYQRIGPLVIGASYNITLDVASGGQAANGSFLFKIFDTVNPQGSVTIFPTAAATTITKTFTATLSNMTIMCNFYSTAEEDFTISNISVQPVSGATVGSPTVESGEVLLDLYEDENLPLTLSVDDFKNVAEKVQSYSKAFNIPETKRNKRIFNQIFEVTREYDGYIFNPYNKTQCVLKQDGFTLFKGFLRLLEVVEKDKEVSYNINLYSEVVALKDIIGNRTFADLDFSELDHDYQKDNIQKSWNENSPANGIVYTNANTSGFRDANSTVKYPFVDWEHQYTTSSGNPVLEYLDSTFRPWINIKYLIDRIFNAPNIPFTYTSNFFSEVEFNRLYMDFNWGSATPPETGSGSLASGDPQIYSNGNWQNLQWYNDSFPDAAGYDASLGYFTCPTDGTTYTIDYDFDITNGSLTLAPNLQLEIDINNTTGIPDITISSWGMQIYPAIHSFTGSASFTLNAGDTWAINMKATTNASYQSLSILNVTTNITKVTSNSLLQTLRGETNQWDFIKGLLTMFNLVTLPDPNNDTNIIIEPYADVFVRNTIGTTLAARSIQHNWTEKIDVSQIKLKPLIDLNKKTIFKYEEDDEDYNFNVYKEATSGYLYGSKEYDAGNEFNILVGEDEIVASPFAATLIRPLLPSLNELIVPVIYSYNPDDGTSSGYDNLPRILYNVGKKTMTTTTYYIPEQNGGASANESNYLQFAHITNVPTNLTTIDYNFGECQLVPPIGSPTPNNLFNTYWLPYYSELYNPNTRIMTINVNLSPSDINTFKFNDKVMIKNRVFRVNKIDYKPKDLSTVEFILIP
tara:strand:- start:6925 stop:9624 length:2700 start_codon:yes stop_codon:yes gene_type:complete